MDIDLSIQSVTRRFETFTAVKAVSFDLPRGHFYSILGPSGCGKTTLLRMIAGFLEPSEGEILIRGQNMRGLPPNRRPVSLVFQHLALFPMMSVADNIAFGLEQRKMPRREIAPRVARMLETVGLAGQGAKGIQQLSGGQRQRVALARSLVLEPAVLMLDEPLGALDLKLRDQMKVELKKLQREVGTTFLYITHDQSEALVMSDKIVVMNQGRLEQLDTPLNCYHQPATPFVAGFLGESNRWQGKLVQAGSDSASVELETGLVVKGKPVGTLNPGAPVQVFVRSEAVRLDPERRETNQVQGRITSAMFDGSAIRLLVRALLGTREGEITVALPERPEYRTLAAGDSVALGWPAEACRCFAGGET